MSFMTERDPGTDTSLSVCDRNLDLDLDLVSGFWFLVLAMR